MLVRLPQMKQSWCAALVATLETKINNRKTENADIGKPKSSSFDLKDKKTRKVKISVCSISESNQTRLNNLCSRIKTSSASSSSLLTARLELMANSKEGQIDAAKCEELKIDQRKCNPVTDMEVDNSIQSEVIEISDDSPEASPSEPIEIPNPPVLSTHKTVGITVHSQVMSLTSAVSEVPYPQPDDSTLHKTNEIPAKSLAALPTLPLSEIPNPPDLEIQNMEVELSEEDAFMNQYNHLKNHLRSSEDLDVELIQEFLNCFLENTLKDLVTIFTFLEMSTIPETSTIMLIKQFLLLEKECSFQATVIFAYHCISVWLGGLQSAPSRNLLAAVTAFAQKHPKAFVDGVMVKQFNTTSLLWPQCDLTVKVVKNFEKETLPYFMEKLVKSNEKDSFSVWNEHMILVLSTVLERRLELDVSIFEKFANWLQFQSLPLASNLKFAKLVLTIINKYGSLVKSWLPTFKQILKENNTFLKKSGLTALKKLED
jgi:hypothetical protein